MLYYIILCYIMLYYVILCYIILCYVILIILHYITWIIYRTHLYNWVPSRSIWMISYVFFFPHKIPLIAKCSECFPGEEQVGTIPRI